MDATRVRRLRDELRTGGHWVSHETVARLLRGLGSSLQANRKVRESTAHPDRDAQFQHLNTTATRALDALEPVISVDTKKKELVGDFKNGGREWRPKGSPKPVRVHDFKDQGHGKAIPSGIFDLASEEGWVQVGIDHDTAQFAVNSIRGWWEHLGRERYPDVSACGRSSCSAWPTRPGWRSRSVTSRRAPASGTRSSIGCSPSSPATGAANCPPSLRRSST